MPDFPDWLGAGCLLGAAGLLIALSLIDLKTRLLPDKLVLPFAVLGVLFHAAQGISPAVLTDMLAGALLGGGLLYAIRLVANRIYQQDTLGLGDVKLMGAAGLWLGPDGILIALVIGALCGMLHGLAVAFYMANKDKKPLMLSTLEVPAGPGF